MSRRPLIRPFSVIALVVALAALAVTALASSRSGSGDTATVHAAGVRAPKLTAPGAGAHVQTPPAFSWKKARGAVGYEFQLSADSRFRSLVSHGAFTTSNTYATITNTLADGTYYWRVRSIDKKKSASGWSKARSVVKTWSDAPELTAPDSGAQVRYPNDPLVLRWTRSQFATKYQVTVATDPSLAQAVITDGPGDTVSFNGRGGPIETADTKLAITASLAPGRYYWAVTPLDTDGHKGARSAVRSFDWSWPSKPSTSLSDLSSAPASSDNGAPILYDPQLSWSSVPGAARYEVEINYDSNWALKSRVCCTDKTIATTLSPKDLLANNTYYWRVRAFDTDGDAGEWSDQRTFVKSFDPLTPSIQNLHIRDNTSDPAAGGTPPTTSSPIVTWNPVPGASSYDVQVMGWSALTGCDVAHPFQTRTASTYWTPLGPTTSDDPAGWADGNPSHDGTHSLTTGDYCVAVRPYADNDTQGNGVVGTFTTLGGNSAPAFHYDAVPEDGSCVPVNLQMQSGSYIGPVGGTTRTTPLFTWQAVPQAASYFVIVARDAAFTQIMDEGYTRIPAYAPRFNSTTKAKTYTDETTSYYWAVIPSCSLSGHPVSYRPDQSNPQAFNKQSQGPQPFGPDDGSDVNGQPVFRWSPGDLSGRDGVKTYQLQVATDASFSNLVDDQTTHSTAYTSNTTYPADTVLYWRVRVTDGGDTRLSWSPTMTFRRRLAAPTLDAPNPSSSEIPALLTWSAVPGATSYDLHLEQPDGSSKDFSGFRSLAASAVKFYGTGNWDVTVRANFAKSGSGETPGPWSRPQGFTRYINPPSGARGFFTPGKSLISWEPSPVGKQYKVQIATTDSFLRTVSSVTTDNTSWAPSLSSRAFGDGSGLWWRVAVVDNGGNVGAWQVGKLRKPRRLQISAKGRPHKGRTTKVVVRVRDNKRHAMKGARVTVSGAGVRANARRTSKAGKVVFRVRATAKGKIVFKATKVGWDPGQATVRVR